MSLSDNSPPKEDSPLLVASGVSRKFGDFLAVKKLDISIKKGDILALLGPNGAGKTTSMRILSGVLAPSSGSVSLCGYDMGSQRIKAQRHLGYLPEGTPQWPLMTPFEILSFRKKIIGKEITSEHWNYVVEASHIEHILHKPYHSLSKGYKRRVSLAEAFLHNPDVLILDEPTDGLDPNQKLETRSFLSSIAPEKAIIISTHILEEAASICSRVAIFHEGCILEDCSMSQLPTINENHEKTSTLEKLQDLFFRKTSPNATN